MNALRESGADSLRRTVTEQMAPVVELYAQLSPVWSIEIDRARARQRQAAGMCAYRPLDVVARAGALDEPFQWATDALGRAGFASPRELYDVERSGADPLELITAWTSGEAVSRDPVRRLARRAAIVLGNSILHCATAAVLDAPLRGWRHAHCPCCAGPPDFAFDDRGERTLMCAKCDALWVATARGCLGCGAADPPTVVHVSSPAIGYGVLICNDCGRYLKERSGPPAAQPVVERALTGKLDLAAEQRGLRL